MDILPQSPQRFSQSSKWAVALSGPLLFSFVPFAQYFVPLVVENFTVVGH